MALGRRFGMMVAPPRADPPGVLAQGPRVTLRRLERPDVDRWLSWPRHQDPLFESYNPPRLSMRQRDRYFRQHVTAPDARQYAIEDGGEELAGRISLRGIDWQHGAAVLGLSLHADRLDQGVGTEALQAFLTYYFIGLRLRSLFLDVAAYNTRAQRVYQKLGFRSFGERWGDPQADAAGIFREAQYQPIRHLFQWDCGDVRPMVIDMVLRRAEWESRGRA